MINSMDVENRLENKILKAREARKNNDQCGYDQNMKNPNEKLGNAIVRV